MPVEYPIAWGSAERLDMSGDLRIRPFLYIEPTSGLCRPAGEYVRPSQDKVLSVEPISGQRRPAKYVRRPQDQVLTVEPVLGQRRPAGNIRRPQDLVLTVEPVSGQPRPAGNIRRLQDQVVTVHKTGTRAAQASLTKTTENTD